MRLGLCENVCLGGFKGRDGVNGLLANDSLSLWCTVSPVKLLAPPLLIPNIPGVPFCPIALVNPLGHA